MATVETADAASATTDVVSASNTALQPIGFDYLPNSFMQWAASTGVTVLVSMALPAAFLGARLPL